MDFNSFLRMASPLDAEWDACQEKMNVLGTYKNAFILISIKHNQSEISVYIEHVPILIFSEDYEFASKH